MDTFLIVYVQDPAISAQFYTHALGVQPVERSATFVLFVLESGLRLGLWRQDGVQPAPTGRAGCNELALCQPDRQKVDTLHQAWQQDGLTIAQAPCQMDFGYTFVALDPDGHRLRVFFPAAE